MTVDMPSDFGIALAYCLAYDLGLDPPEHQTIGGLRGMGEGAHTESERSLTQLRALADSVLKDNPTSEYQENTPRHLQRIQQHHAYTEQQTVALIMGGATKIKQYVFESSKLPEIRGASALLDRINLVDIPALFNVSFTDVDDKQRAQEVRENFERRHHMAPPTLPDCLIYANGGEFLAFAPTKLAPQLAAEIEFLYTSETLIANSVAVWQPFSLEELAGGVGASVFWQRWADPAYRQRVEAVLGVSAAKALPKKKRFGELAAALASEKFRRREGNPSPDYQTDLGRRAPKSTPQWETFAYGRRCRSCERRLASHTFPLPEEEQAVCEACYRKLEMGWEQKRGWVKHFEHFLLTQGKEEHYYYSLDDQKIIQDVRPLCQPRRWDGARLPDRPQDLHEIAKASTPQGYVGVIYADGNNMGAFLETLRSPQAYHDFAKAVWEAMQRAVFGALAQALHPVYVQRESKKRQEPFWVHPFEILSIGGDDLFLIVPVHQALPIAIAIAQGVEEILVQDPSFQKTRTYASQQVHRCTLEATNRSDDTLQSAVGLSAGVLLADVHTPIFFQQILVEQLLKSAKRRAKELRKQDHLGGTIDFMALKSVTMITSKLDEFRISTLRVGPDRLTARPYTLLEMRQLLDTVRVLKSTRFPRSQLYALRQALWEGRLASTVDYLYFTERLGRQERDQIRAVLDQRWCQGGAAPWRRVASGAHAETVLADLIELYDFVEGGAACPDPSV